MNQYTYMVNQYTYMVEPSRRNPDHFVVSKVNEIGQYWHILTYADEATAHYIAWVLNGSEENGAAE